MENRSYIRIETESGPCWAEERGGEACLLTEAPFFGGVDTGWRRPLESVRLLAPFEGNKMVCVGKNYFDHIEEMKEAFGDGVPEKPVLFIKPSTCVNDPGGVVSYPAVSHRVDFEGELAIVIGRRMTRNRRPSPMSSAIPSATTSPPGTSRRGRGSGPAARPLTASRPSGPGLSPGWTRRRSPSSPG